MDDLIDFTPELRAEAVKIVSRYKLGPIFTPPVVSKAEGPLGTLAMATAQGGTVWPGGSFDPETHIAVSLFAQVAARFSDCVPANQSDFAWVQGTAAERHTERRAAAGADASRGPGRGSGGG